MHHLRSGSADSTPYRASPKPDLPPSPTDGSGRWNLRFRLTVNSVLGQDPEVATLTELLVAVNTEFQQASRNLTSWPNPHQNRSPDDAEYSRLTNPARWQIIPARADAWLSAITQLRLAATQPAGPDIWATPPGPVITRNSLVVPHAQGGLPLVVARTQLAHIPNAGVTLGIGNPATPVVTIPDCGCDACDSGSQDALDELDAHLQGIVTGAFRKLTNRTRHITVIGDGGWSASGLRRRDNVNAILANPTGWTELSGSTWL